jgi:hypothetical protein
MSQAEQLLSARAAAAASGVRQPAVHATTSGRMPPAVRIASLPSCATATAARALQADSCTSLRIQGQEAAHGGRGAHVSAFEASAAPRLCGAAAAHVASLSRLSDIVGVHFNAVTRSGLA